MKYNFDEVIDRSKNRSAKYDEREKKFGRKDVIPLWIADMDFKTAQPIIDAVKAKAEEGIWGYTSRPASYYEAVCGWQKRRNGWEIDKSKISFSLGVVPTLSSIVEIFTEPGDKVLMCSDGLSNMIEDDRLFDVINANNVEDSVKILIDEAKKNGGYDNITAIVIEPQIEEVNEC